MTVATARFGTVFRVNADGTGFSGLHSFTNNEGEIPEALMLIENNLFGTTVGLYSGTGTVFALTTNGSEFAVLHHFNTTTGLNSTNSDGANPYAGLILSDGTLFGTAKAGGNGAHGPVFSITTAPLLTITQANSSDILTWPATAVGFALESTTDLTMQAEWIAATPAPKPGNGLKMATNDFTATPVFFRLKR